MMQVLQTFAERHYVANSLRCLEVASGSYGSLPDVVSPSESPRSNYGCLLANSISGRISKSICRICDELPYRTHWPQQGRLAEPTRLSHP
jgi:hypothetical protein